MTAGPLHPDNLTGGRDHEPLRGHDTRALGPSDSSDSGSDVAGRAGVASEGDLSSNSDRNGTGEAPTVPGDLVAADGADIDTDHVERMPEEGDGGEDEEGEDEARPPKH